MTFARRLLLVESAPRYGQLIQTHLHKTFLLATPTVRPADLPELVTRETDGVLLFLASDPADLDWIEQSTRELRLQQFPAKLAVLVCAPAVSGYRLEALTDRLDARFNWPDQLRDLNAWVRRTVTPGVPFADPKSEQVGQRLRRRLTARAPSLAPLCNQLDLAVAHDVAVLIEGESGTGKTFLARLIHDCSPRAAHRFTAVSCGALVGPPVASELFGHVPGAFIGADAARIGKFAAVGQGTILLNDIHALTADHQAALLRLIETGEFEPVGGHLTQRTQARVICATDRDLADVVEQGRFRRDLFYRLHVITLKLPPLRSRPQDIAPLARGLVTRYAAHFGKKIAAIEPSAVRALEHFSWPGNIRQLENVIQQAVLGCDNDTLDAEHFQGLIALRDEGLSGGLDIPSSLAQNRESTERAAIVRALEKVSQSRTRASQILGVSRVTLYKKMKKYGLLDSNGTTHSNGSGYHAIPSRR